MHVWAWARRGEAVLNYLLILAPAVQGARLLWLLGTAVAFISICTPVWLIVLSEVLNCAGVLEIHVVIL